MTFKKFKMFALAIGLSTVLAACGGNDDGENSDAADDSKEINLAYVEWDTEVASTHVVAEVLEDIGYDVTLTPLDNAIMWESVANGEADGMVSAWLPHTHASQYEQYKDDFEDLGENLVGAKIGLVVPTYMDNVTSIEDLTDQADQKITGIEPGAGIMAATEKALEDYNLAGWELVASSSGAMNVSLDQAIKNHEEIIITGWSPHWMFASYDLKYLEDPKGIYGGEETIKTIVRKGLKEDMPEAYQVLDAFYWTTDDIEAVMSDINKGTDPEEAAEKWIEENPDKVAEWTKGIE